MATHAPRLPPPAPKRSLASPRPPTPIYRQVNDNRPAAPGPVVQTLLTDRGPGRPLPDRVRESMELALGHSFAEVRIHTDAQAAAAAEELHARAFTAGKDIFFAEGAFDPGAPASRDLLAHELAHAASQPEGAPFDPALLEAVPGDPLAEQAVTMPEQPEPQPPDPAEPAPAPLPEPAQAPAPVDGEAEGEAGAPEAPSEGEGGREAPSGGAGEGEGEAAGDLATGESPPLGRSDVELLMPPPPDRPSPGQTERIERSTRAAGRAAGRAENLPSAGESTAAARGAVDEPETETRGHAEATLAGALAERPAPSPEVLELCEVIRASIKAKRPVDEDELVETDPAGVAEEAGTALNQNVQGEADRVDASYDELDDPPAGEAEQIGEPFETPPAEAALPDLQAAEAAPDPIPEENLALDADVERADADMAAAGMDTPAAQVAQEGPVAEAGAARGEVGELAQQSPAELAAAQDQAIAAAQGDMAALQQQALESLNAARGGTVAGVAGQQRGMVTSEVATREQISAEARQIFSTTQTAVDGLLRPLPQTAMDLWEAGVAKASTRFEEALARVKAWIEERHSGIGGAILGAWDALTGLPDWVTEEYDRAERQFGDDVCDLLIAISTQVNAVIQSCELLISTARSQIDALFADLPESLRAWAEEEKARLNGQLDQLGERVQSAQAEVTSGLRERAVSAVAEVQRRVAELREQARGILGKIADAIAAFIDDPVKFIIEGILKLLGISPAAFWAVVAKIREVIDDIADDPLGFANNLVSAIGQGFQKFFDNFVDHLIGGFFDWLFSGLGAVGVTIPSDFSLPSIITFALELMGITWARIREILARHIGEENVALLEKAYELISTLIEKGPEGIFEMIKEQLNPQTILDQIIKAAVDYLIEALIRAVTPRIIALFNPAGAIIQALELIYRVLKWIFENAARIFSLIETVVGGAADLVAGNVGGMASAVEGALAKLIAPVIDFLAGYLGLGDLPEKIADTIRGFQEMVLGIIDRVVAWLAERARGLLRALGIGEEPGPEEAEGERAGDSELGTSVTFAGGGEGHRQWVEIQGTDAVLMVASDGPGPVEAKLAEWKSSDKFPPDDPRRQEADGLIAQAEGLLGQADSKADALVTAYRQASQSAGEEGQELPSDDPLEGDQQRLVAALRRLFELFGVGDGIEFEPIEETAAMTGGQEFVHVQSDRTKLTLRIGGVPGAGVLEQIAAGPLGRGANTRGLTLVSDVSNAVRPYTQSISAIRLIDNKIEAAAAESVKAAAQRIAAEMSRIGQAMKILSLDRAKRVEPMASYPITFSYPEAKNQRYKGKFSEELQRQLVPHFDGLNRFTIDEWVININLYQVDEATYLSMDASGRTAILDRLRDRATEAASGARTKAAEYEAALREIDAVRSAAVPRVPDLGKIAVVAGRYGNETEWRKLHAAGVEALYDRLIKEDQRVATISRTLSRIAVLHNPDQIAGGPGEIPDVEVAEPPGAGEDVTGWETYLNTLHRYVGVSRVNSSIGAQWKTLMDGAYRFATDTSLHPEEVWPIVRLNFVFGVSAR